MKRKLLTALMTLTLVCGFTIHASAGWFFGKKQHHEHGWSDGKCAYIRHYYEERFFGFTVGTGYEDEKVGCIE
jgi:hypothetical protein